MDAFGDKDASNPTAYTFVLVCSILNALTLVFATFRLHRRMLLHARRKHQAQQLPGSPDAAGVANAAVGSPPPKRRRISLTPASVSRVGCFLTPSPGGKLSRACSTLSPASRRASAAGPGAAPAAAPGAAPAADGAAPAAAGTPAAAGSGKARLKSLLVKSAKLEERRKRRRRLAAMIAAAEAAVEAGRTDLGALAWG